MGSTGGAFVADGATDVPGCCPVFPVGPNSPPVVTINTIATKTVIPTAPAPMRWLRRLWSRLRSMRS